MDGNRDLQMDKDQQLVDYSEDSLSKDQVFRSFPSIAIATLVCRIYQSLECSLVPISDPLQLMRSGLNDEGDTRAPTLSSVAPCQDPVSIQSV